MKRELNAREISRHLDIIFSIMYIRQNPGSKEATKTPRKKIYKRALIISVSVKLKLSENGGQGWGMWLRLGSKEVKFRVFPLIREVLGLSSGNARKCSRNQRVSLGEGWAVAIGSNGDKIPGVPRASCLFSLAYFVHAQIFPLCVCTYVSECLCRHVWACGG